MDELDLVEVARLVDALNGGDATDRDEPASLFAVSSPTSGVVDVLLLGRGHAVELLEWACIPEGTCALVVCASGWIVQDHEVGSCRPSQHPARRRVAMSAAIGGGDQPEIVTVLRVGDAPEEVLEGGEGEIPDALRRTWSHIPPSTLYK